MNRNEVRRIVLEVLHEVTAGTIKNEPECDADGDEWNNYVFDGQAFVDAIERAAEGCIAEFVPPDPTEPPEATR